MRLSARRDSAARVSRTLADRTGLANRTDLVAHIDLVAGRNQATLRTVAAAVRIRILAAARSLAAYCGFKVYLDVALSWVVAKSAYCPIALRNPSDRASGYSLSRLFSHFWRLVLTSGTRPLRLVSLLGLGTILFGAVVSAYILWEYFTGNVPIPGYTSLIILLCIFSGSILFSLGIVAEYLGASLSVAMGRPLYVVVSKPMRFTKPISTQ